MARILGRNKRWNKAKAYGVKRNVNEHRELLQNILAEEQWIIEGVYYKWCRQCFADADKIYLLEFMDIERGVQEKIRTHGSLPMNTSENYHGN